MTRSIGKLLSQGLLLLGPLLTVNWSFLNLLGFPGGPNDPTTINLLFYSLSGEKQQVEMKLRIIASIVGFALVITYEVIDIVIPRRELSEFRSAYLGQQKEEWRNDPNNQIPDYVRINIMHVRHPWYTLFIGRFYWTWNDGFNPPNHRDANLLLLTFQGVAGATYRARAAQAVDFRESPSRPVQFSDYVGFLVITGIAAFATLLLYLVFLRNRSILYLLVPLIVIAVYLAIRVLRQNEFRLWPWQAKKTEYVKYILSVPLFKASKGDSKAFKRVGVINLDTTTDEGATFLQANEGRLVTYFLDRGKVIACLR
jgi:hypothetical protein